MKATAVAPANIAFIKYWGRKDKALRLPYNPSISMNLSACITTTTVEFSPDFTEDRVSKGFHEERVIEHLDRLRKIAGTEFKANVMTKNSFPASAGIASSASGFAALTVAAAAALNLHLSEQELSVLSRLGSGSACRSISDGFVKWDGEYAYSLYPHEYWDLRDILVIVDAHAKKTSSSEGHDNVETSPLFQKRLQELPSRIRKMERALREKNFLLFGEILEEDCLDMHGVMQTQDPPLMYWTDETKKLMEEVRDWRKEGLPVYFTIDAGPNVHLLCEAKHEREVLKRVQGRQIIVNIPSKGAHIV